MACVAVVVVRSLMFDVCYVLCLVRCVLLVGSFFVVCCLLMFGCVT